MSSQRVLLTGATGFIGQRLQAELAAADYPLSAIVRPTSRNSGLLLPQCRAIRCDLGDRDAIAAACADADAVIYCAGTVRGRSLGDFTPANVDGLAVLTEVMNQGRRATPLLLISSLAAMRPEISDYAMSKHMGEEVLRQQARFPWTIFRPPAVYGPGDREMLPLLKMARRGLVTPTGPSDQRLSLLHADDLARAVSAWLDRTEACQGMTFSLDDGRPGGYDWPAIAAAATNKKSYILPIPRPLLLTAGWLNQLMATVFRYAPMLTPGKSRELTQADWLCDNTQLENVTGWRPRIDLETGIRDLFADA